MFLMDEKRLGINYKITPQPARWFHPPASLNFGLFQDYQNEGRAIEVFMNKIKNMSGKRFGKLICLGLSSRAPGSMGVFWRTACDCGKMLDVCGANMRRGNTKSCGCQREISVSKHGQYGKKVYHIWQGMRDRCSNHKATSWKYYGGKGVVVCDRWNSFRNFYNDMGDPPFGTSIDRIDTAGNYTPKNCRWANSRLQSRNKRNNRHISHGGRSMILNDWATFTGLRNTTVHNRLKVGWSIKDALTIKSRKRGNR